MHLILSTVCIDSGCVGLLGCISSECSYFHYHLNFPLVLVVFFFLNETNFLCFLLGGRGKGKKTLHHRRGAKRLWNPSGGKRVLELDVLMTEEGGKKKKLCSTSSQYFDSFFLLLNMTGTLGLFQLGNVQCVCVCVSVVKNYSLTDAGNVFWFLRDPYWGFSTQLNVATLVSVFVCLAVTVCLCVWAAHNLKNVGKKICNTAKEWKS